MQLAKTRTLAPDLVFLDQVDSTNLELARRLTPQTPELFTILAAEQTAGLGRLGRSWISTPESSLSISILLKPRNESEASFITLLAANCVHRALGKLTGSDGFSIKWPNDILFSGRKACGILAQLTPGGVILGIGVNLKQQPGTPENTFSLEELGGFSFDDVAHSILLELTAAWQKLKQFGVSSELEYIRSNCSTLGQQVRAELPDGSVIVGVANAITEGGHLIVAGDEETELSAADVWHLRN